MDRVSPHNLDAERAVLGAIMVDNRQWTIVAARIGVGDLFRAAHQQVYRAMLSLAAAGVGIDLVTVCNAMAQAGTLEDAGGHAYVASLLDGIPISLNAQYYAGIVREHAQRRDLIQIANRLIADAHDSDQESAALADLAVHSLYKAVQSTSGGPVWMDDAVAAYVDGIVSGKVGLPMPTGFTDLDHLIGGFKPGELIIVAARPGTGKTSFLLGLLEHVARHTGPAGIFSLEMSQAAMAARSLALRSGVSIQALSRQTANADEYAMVYEALGLERRQLWLETKARTVSEMAAWSRKQKDQYGLACIGVDYIQLAVPDRDRHSDEGEIADISRSLSRLAHDLEVPVVALSQLSRAPEGRKDKRPQPSDLRGSGALEQDADMVILLFRGDDDKSVAEVIVAKNRNGETGMIKLHFNGPLTRFGNLQADAGN